MSRMLLEGVVYPMIIAAQEKAFRYVMPIVQMWMLILCVALLTIAELT